MNALEMLEPATRPQIRAVQQMSSMLFGGPLVLGEHTGIYQPDGTTDLKRGDMQQVLTELRKIADTTDQTETRKHPDAYMDRFARWATETEETPSRRTPMPKTDDTIASYGAKVFNLESERPCPDCGGTGTVDSDPDDKDITRLILDRDSLTGLRTSKVAAMLANPDLELLKRIAKLADSDLDGAAKISIRLSKMYADS